MGGRRLGPRTGVLERRFRNGNSRKRGRQEGTWPEGVVPSALTFRDPSHLFVLDEELVDVVVNGGLVVASGAGGPFETVSLCRGPVVSLIHQAAHGKLLGWVDGVDYGA